MDKREGEASRFPSKITCPKVPKNSVWELFSLSTISGIENILDKREGEVSRFPSEDFCLTVPEHFVDEPFYAVYQKCSGSQKVYG